MSIYSAKQKVYPNFITFPATKTGGTALTISSEVVYNTNLGEAILYLTLGDKSKITNNLTINLKGSYDGGTTWLLLGALTDFASGGTNGTSTKLFKFPAPLLKAEAVFDGTGALTPGHNLNVNLVVADTAVDSGNATKKLITSTTLWPNTTQAQSLNVYGLTFHTNYGLSNFAVSTTTMTPELVKAVRILLIPASGSTFAGTTDTAVLNQSFDGTNWLYGTAATGSAGAVNTQTLSWTTIYVNGASQTVSSYNFTGVSATVMLDTDLSVDPVIAALGRYFQFGISTAATSTVGAGMTVYACLEY